MKKIWMSLLCASFLTGVGTCDEFYCGARPGCLNTSSGFYAKGFAGANWAQRPSLSHTKYETSSGYLLGAALGYRFEILSLEGEFTYRHNTIDRLKVEGLNLDVSGDLDQYCGFVNGIVGLPVMSCLSPYVGLGVGYRHINPGVNFDESDDRSLDNFIKTSNQWGVYQAFGGIAFPTTDYLNLQVEYRYMDGWKNQQCGNHSVAAGATFCF